MLRLTVFKNTMVQLPTVNQLLPLPKTEDAEVAKHHWDYIYEPNPAEILKVVFRSLCSTDGLSGCT